MKTSTIIACLGAAALAVLGAIMAKTNPTQVEYQDYAVQRLTQYLKTDVCQKTQGILESLVKFNCVKTVDSINPQMRDIIAATTQRQDYLLFSIYQTDLKVSSLIPSYKFETVGAFNNFYTYSAQQR
ncbi:DUF4359 domain-containing protein [Tolypothrix sp. FACHB-123]|uniref:DUF4359 domain-containing protein n=1 Tax=Tolypothrix sp. FACHB-123 TaxID=2692868 RepID=UPI001689CC52|nr:DUF4359 domain-containing protein [Tolypothrix sp. FACHB-123]MBD2356520.1 DUF4359 domain-containing protein [Tolypothrix sp. FACHB-123]